jgi:predicted DNA-binding mobile mystery protein A
MPTTKEKLLLRQMDQKLKPFIDAGKYAIPEGGWIYHVRTAIHMGLGQLGERLDISPQAVKQMEQREQDGSLTLKRLRDVAAAMDMQLVYGFAPNVGSLETMVEQRALEIVLRKNPSASDRVIRLGIDDLRNNFPGRLWNLSSSPRRRKQ